MLRDVTGVKRRETVGLKESGKHGKIPSYKDCNEGIVPGFSDDGN